MTKNAARILSLVNGTDEHLTAEQIYLRLKGQGVQIALSTIYNNLSELCRTGQIRKISTAGSPDRYDRSHPHGHLICARCSALYDVTLPDLTGLLQQATGIQILSYDLEIHYLCPSCQKRVQKAEVI